MLGITVCTIYISIDSLRARVCGYHHVFFLESVMVALMKRAHISGLYSTRRPCGGKT